MSSDEEDSSNLGKQLDRSLLVKLICDNPVVLEKSKTPSVVSAKKKAWDQLADEFSRASGKRVEVGQLTKTLNNMKTSIKKKTDKTATGNKPIKLKQWEKDFLVIMQKDTNPVFCKVPEGLSIGTKPIKKCTLLQEEEIIDSSSSSAVVEPSPKIKRSEKIIQQYETDETKDLSLSQLQRMVLLHQLQLNKIQIEKKKLELGKWKQEITVPSTHVEQSTQTDKSLENVLIYECL